MSSQSAPSLPPAAALLNLTAGFWTYQMLRVVAELDIPGLLKEGPRTAGELASAAAANEDALFRVLRALASQGVFEETENRRFQNTALSELLRGDVPGSLRSWTLMVGAEPYWKIWSALDYAVRTGGSAVEKVHGKGIFEVLHGEPELARHFDQAMNEMSATEIPAILDAYDFNGIRKIVDVAGGHGTLLRSVLQAHPEMEGILIDLPAVIDGARKTFRAAGLDGRCRAEPADMFQSVPDGADAYMMKHIIHDWDDDKSIQILTNCRKAMAPQGKVLIMDAVIQPGNAPDLFKLVDICMLTFLGRERSEAEFRSVLERSGLKLNRIVPTSSPVCVVEAVAV